ncbi:hypothetical protein LC193_10400 [Streptomyces marincola]|nr:hypothetical protein LC193_10400 [Streptomyces marincola]
MSVRRRVVVSSLGAGSGGCGRAAGCSAGGAGEAGEAGEAGGAGEAGEGELSAEGRRNCPRGSTRPAAATGEVLTSSSEPHAARLPACCCAARACPRSGELRAGCPAAGGCAPAPAAGHAPAGSCRATSPRPRTSGSAFPPPPPCAAGAPCGSSSKKNGCVSPARAGGTAGPATAGPAAAPDGGVGTGSPSRGSGRLLPGTHAVPFQYRM